ncbi:acyltransferase [Vibrio splendidus]|uniref:acyltransferase n=1 Tax=Vibrio splendidus TaxID=29497 RepID=UPI000D366AB1|nr:acyltransferase [Vibrio splendidus]MCC4882885.1 acyltransferase [Vibrio splendidus]PTO57620.1 acyltransferase [Vibrio splendidus]
MLIKFYGLLIGFIYSFIYKIIYFSSSRFSFYKVSFNGSLIISSGGSLHFKGRFRSRSGSNFNINGGELVLGERVFFNRGVSINCRDRISIGKNSMFGEDVKIYDHDHEIKQGKISLTSFFCSPINIGDNVWVGSNVIILKGVDIGDNSVISAGSIVTKSIPKGSIFMQKRSDTICKS